MQPSFLRKGLAVAGLALWAPAAVAQAPAAQPAAMPETTLHVNTNLVLVDVVVTERDKAAHGLERSRFHIFEDGREQAISSFDERQPAAAGAAAAKPVALPPHTYTNVPAYRESTAVNVLLLDGLNTLAANQEDVRKQMLQYIGTIRPGTSIAIFALSSHLRQLSGFTTDPAELAKALKNKKAGSQQSRLLDPEEEKQQAFSLDDWAHIPGAPAEAIANAWQFQADTRAEGTDQRVAMTVEALQDLARYLSGIPGRKNLIWFSGSFPVALDPDVTLDNPFQAVRNFTEQIRETSDLLSAARVAVYPVDARGLIGLPSMDSSTLSTAGMRPTSTVAMGTADEQAVRELGPERGAMQQIAAATGGKEFNNSNGLKEAVAEAVENGSSYYTVGYVPAAKQFDGQFRKLMVKVDGGKFKLAYRNGYYADPPDKPSEHTLAKSSLMLEATLKGAPAATQILFQMRVLASTDPLLVDANLPSVPLGELAGGLKGPLYRYVVDLKVDPRGFAYEETPDEARHASAEFTLVAYGEDGRRVNYSDHSIPLNLKKEQYMEILATGLPVRLALDLPAGGYWLRVAVRDRVTGRIGSLEIPLAAGK